jgi:hypothetical protein
MRLVFTKLETPKKNILVDLGTGEFEEFSLQELEDSETGKYLQLPNGIPANSIRVKTNSEEIESFDMIKDYMITDDEGNILGGNCGNTNKKKQLMIDIVVGSSYYSTNVSPGDILSRDTLYGGWSISNFINDYDLSDFIKIESNGSLSFKEDIQFECDSPLIQVEKIGNGLSLKYNPTDFDKIVDNLIQLTLTTQVSEELEPLHFYVSYGCGIHLETAGDLSRGFMDLISNGYICYKDKTDNMIPLSDIVNYGTNEDIEQQIWESYGKQLFLVTQNYTSYKCTPLPYKISIQL